MAVKVISEGPDPSIIKEIICKNCGAKLSYVPNDVKDRHGVDYSGGYEGEEWIDCPLCNKEVIIRCW